MTMLAYVRLIQSIYFLPHDHRTDCWIAVKGNVYDVTPYLQEHPGGVSAIVMNAGKDATEDFGVRACACLPVVNVDVRA